MRRLESSVRRCPGGLRLGSWTVAFHGVPGGNVRRLSAWVRQQVACHYDIVYIHLGSNDLCSSDNVSGLVEALLDLARYLLHCWGVRQVVISELLLRWSNDRYRMPFTLSHYNIAVVRVNDILEDRCRQLDGVTFWLHRRLRSSSWFSDDGVHFNRSGEQRFMRSVRGALLSSQPT